MKNLILSIVMITALAACNSNDKNETTQRDIQLLRDSTVYTNSNIYSDTIAGVTVEDPVIEPVKEKTIPGSYKKKTVNAPSRKGSTAPVYVEKGQGKQETTVATPPINPGSGAGTNGSTTSSTPQTQKKKGWDKATTGAVIGGAAGAAGGAIIVSKKKGVGAVVGAVVGAASGYIIGKDMDKKDKQKQ
ncbi:MAG: glycine zipper domain-containing protein [Ginsengibacter sp.]